MKKGKGEKEEVEEEEKGFMCVGLGMCNRMRNLQLQEGGEAAVIFAIHSWRWARCACIRMWEQGRRVCMYAVSAEEEHKGAGSS